MGSCAVKEENVDVQYKPYFSKNTTDIIKGIALILMFVHHFFTTPYRLVEGIAYPELEYFVIHFCDPFQICVPVFAFLTGYLYYFNKNKSYKYSFKKIVDILIHYWVVYIPLLIIAIVFCGYEFDMQIFKYELLALKRPIMFFCWYVAFYWAMMLILPVVVKLLPCTYGGGV